MVYCPTLGTVTVVTVQVVTLKLASSALLSASWLRNNFLGTLAPDLGSMFGRKARRGPRDAAPVPRLNRPGAYC